MGKRIFIYDGKEYPDPDPNLTADQARQWFANWYPDLNNADVREEKRGEDTLYTLSRRTGTKG